jgi:hypothetical protein
VQFGASDIRLVCATDAECEGLPGKLATTSARINRASARPPNKVGMKQHAVDDVAIHHFSAVPTFGHLHTLLDLRGNTSHPSFGTLLTSIIKPDIRQILVEVVAWRDLPALYIRAHWYDPVPPGYQ